MEGQLLGRCISVLFAQAKEHTQKHSHCARCCAVNRLAVL